MMRTCRAIGLFLVVFTSADSAAPLNSKQAANTINDDFTGRGAASGVVMRLVQNWEIWCHEGCYHGHAFSKTSASFYNLRVGVENSKFVAKYGNAGACGVVFNSTMVETQLARCWYANDALSNMRYNGGCGCLAPIHDRFHCSTHSPYVNIGPDGKYIYGDSPEAERCRCTSINESVFIPVGGCFWRGPAFNTSHGPFNASELKQVVEQREHALAHHQSWNDEVVIDSCRLQDVLKTDPASALLAVFFYDGEHTESNLNQAEALQQQLLEKYGVRLPLVGVSSSVVVSSTSGPFFEHPPTSPETAGSGSDAAVVV